MNNLKFLILFIFIICLPFVIGREESKLINLNLQNNSNLTITLENNNWWFNISSGILDVNINYTFEVYPEYISNCSEWFEFSWDECFNVNDALRSIQTRLETQLAGCEEPTSDIPGNLQCWRKSSLLENKTKDFDYCKTDLSAKITLASTLKTKYDTCVTERDNKYNKTSINILIIIIVGGGFFIFIYQRKGITTDQKQVERKKGGPDMDGINRKEFDDAMKQEGVV